MASMLEIKKAELEMMVLNKYSKKEILKKSEELDKLIMEEMIKISQIVN